MGLWLELRPLDVMVLVLKRKGLIAIIYNSSLQKGRRGFANI